MDDQMEEYRKRQREQYQKRQQDGTEQTEAPADEKGNSGQVSAAAAADLVEASVQDAGAASSSAGASAGTGASPPSGSLKLVTWNVDGLDEGQIQLRHTALADWIKTHKPDIVYLQEVVYPTLRILRKHLTSTYDIIIPTNPRPDPSDMESLTRGIPCAYFCAVLLNKQSIQACGAPDSKWYPQSCMMRHLLSIRARPTAASAKDAELLLGTSHLESTAEYKNERVNQLSIVATNMEGWLSDPDTPSVCTVIVGGDLNLRDPEVKAAGVPSHIRDVWELLGKPDSCRYTWDMAANDNLVMQGGGKPRCRFDRLFIGQRPQGSASPPSGRYRWVPQSIEMVGTDRLSSCGRFISDHFGLLVKLELAVPTEGGEGGGSKGQKAKAKAKKGK
ncbi:unnamed protein product [Vitrella brassicaformis CCMP3155]|uniref:Endonuclease/exonuclease/phosphatase domain-containing protein n=1 Tax=Vitrella brassicaformis (strain CCMP3155) TaxID=1169540 RepID=A0A0G4FMW5_VITBC|nr:unnamed protein product [Vitrella brassicaformis CCMP3155]|eukprot:CEM15524.1 unnamed protein product [Vitrella brassicaformis CCMP3155]